MRTFPRISPLAHLLVVVLPCAALATIAVLLFAPRAAEAITDGCAEPPTSRYCPNLQALEARDLRVETIGNRRRLRFTTTTMNVGPGALELEGGEVVGRSKQTVYQRLYDRPSPDGNPAHYMRQAVGQFVYHPGHRHFHLDGYALYELFPSGADQAPVRWSRKTSFCVQDTLTIAKIPPPTPPAPPYGTDVDHYPGCTAELQGMSRGWADRYGYQLAGQEFDVTSLTDDCYVLRITVNPQGDLYETRADDNARSLAIRLAGKQVTVGCPSG